MKRILIILFSAILLTVAVANTARAGFGTGVIVGALLSNSRNVVGLGDSNVLYVMPRVNERVKDPLEMKMAATYPISFSPHSHDAGKSLKDLFKEAVTSSDKYDLLQVTRILDPKDPARAVIWFVYIEKEFVIPLEKLPKEN